MLFIINPSKDASLYNNSASMNAGMNEVLDVADLLNVDGTFSINRALVKFDLSTLPTGSSASGSRSFTLKLFATNPVNLPATYSVQISPVSQSWVMGLGTRWDTPQTTEGASWTFRSGVTENDYWIDSGSATQGGTWFTGPGLIVTESFNYSTSDLCVDVSSIVEQWLSGSSPLPNEGFIIKFTDAEESSSINYGNLKFFSKDTNTVYKPRLVLAYDDSAWSGSIPVGGTLTSEDPSVYVKALHPEYPSTTISTVRVVARQKYPLKTFVTSASAYADIEYLPSSSYYGVKDVYSGEYIVPFDTNYTKLSADGLGNFFTFNFGTLFVNRIYKFMFQTQVGGMVKTYDSDLIFKVTRG